MTVRRLIWAVPAALVVASLVLVPTFLLIGGCSNDDNPVVPEIAPSTTVTDIDGNVYQTVKIGDQWWMTQNLKVTRYRNGDPIPDVTLDAEWTALATGASSAYEHNAANVASYGLLYNWYAAADTRHIAPAGWHVPSEDEWQELERQLGMSQAQVDSMGWRGGVEGGKLKEAGASHWTAPNEGATDEVGFCAMPGGMRHMAGYFQALGTDVYFWTATAPNVDRAWLRSVSRGSTRIYRTNDDKRYGLSIRCVKD
jgi:uncharacterized protein (TIGR02145 family)